MIKTLNHRNDGTLKKIASEQRLVEQALGGCADSFRQLVQENHQLVRLYLAKFVRCSSQVDDLAQEVFLIAFSELSQFRRDSKFSTWLIGVARNKAFEFLRADVKSRQIRQQYGEAKIVSLRIARLEEQQRDSELAQQKIAGMQLCLAELPSRSRDLVHRFYFDQQSITELALKANVSAGSMRMKLLRIRQILRKCIIARMDGADSEVGF